MKPSELFRFACQCLLLPSSNRRSNEDEYSDLVEYIREKFITGQANKDRFISLCSNHLVLPAITLKFQQHGLLDLCSEEYKNHLLDILEINRKRNREILHQVDEINTVLAKENIQPIYLKGTGNLLDNLYSDIGERMIGDIDVLVQEQDYFKAADIILKLGYKNDIPIYYDIKVAKHYPRLYKEDVPADIEIHRVPVNIKYSNQFSTDLLYKQKKEISDFLNCFVSCAEQKIIHTFIHSGLSNKGFRNRTLVLRDLYDAYLLSKKVDLDNVLDQIEEQYKAKFFFDTVNYLFEPAIDNINSPNKYASQHRWFLNHPKWHRLYLLVLNLYDLIIIRYVIRILKAFFHKSSFHHIYVRLKDPHWYKLHFEGVKKIFRR